MIFIEIIAQFIVWSLLGTWIGVLVSVLARRVPFSWKKLLPDREVALVLLGPLLLMGAYVNTGPARWDARSMLSVGIASSLVAVILLKLSDGISNLIVLRHNGILFRENLAMRQMIDKAFDTFVKDGDPQVFADLNAAYKAMTLDGVKTRDALLKEYDSP